MSQLLRFISLYFLIFVSVCPHLLGQCPNKGFINGSFSITGSGGGITVDGDGDDQTTASNNTVLRICEGESLVLSKTAATTGTVGGVNYWLINEERYNSGAYTFPSSSSTSFANYDPSLGSTNTQVTLKAANLPDATSASPYKYSGPGRYLLIQKDQSYAGGTPDNYYACQVIEIVSPTITKPNFTATSCIDGSVVVSLPADASNNIFYNYKVDYNNTVNNQTTSTVSPNNPTYDYNFSAIFLASTTVNETFRVSVTGQTLTGGCVNATDSKTIIAKVVKKPRAGLIVGQATDGTYEVEFVAEKDVKREVFVREANNGYNYATPFANFISGDPDTRGYEKQIYTVSDPTKQYCFIARAIEKNTSCPIGNVINADVEACTTTLNISAGDRKNMLTWSPFVTGMRGGTYQNYWVFREGTELPIATIPSIGTTTYTDSDPSLVCGNIYKYTVTTVYGSQSKSSPKEIKFQQTTASAALDKVFVSVSDDNSYVTIDGSLSTTIPSGGSPKYHYYRTRPIGSATEYNDDELFFKDIAVNTSKEQYCYYMTWNDGACLESEKSKEVCTILLKRNGNLLTWTSDSPMAEPKGDYNVDHAPSPDGFVGGSSTLPFTTGTSTDFDLENNIPPSDGIDFYLRVNVQSATGTGAKSYSNHIHYERPVMILLPQIFTPDANAINETFEVQGRHIRKTKMWIYDRWGSPIYYQESENKEDSTTGLWKDTGWDGTLNSGLKAAQGNYVYKVEIEDAMGKKTIKSGALNLTY